SSGGSNTTESMKSECNLTGTWAVRADLEQNVPASFFVQAQSDVKDSIWLLITRRHDGEGLMDRMTFCGQAIADFHESPLLGGSWVGVEFPNDPLDKGFFPSFAVLGTAGTKIGAKITSETFAIQLGIDMPDVATRPWPSNAEVQQNFMTDMDMDGKPGISTV